MQKLQGSKSGLIKDKNSTLSVDTELRSLVETYSNSPIPILITDSQTKIIYVNEAWESKTGYKLSEVSGKNPKILQSGQTPKSTYQKMWHSLERHKPFSSQQVIDKKKDGTYYQLFSTIFPVVKDGKNILYFQIHQDISEQKLIGESKSRLASLIANSYDSIIGTDSDAKITIWNAAAEKMYGYKAKEILGQPIFKLMPQKAGKFEIEVFKKLKKGKGSEHYETQRIKKDGTLIDIEVSVAPIKDSSGKVVGFSGISRDITQEKLLEEKLIESEKEYRFLFEKNPNPMYIYEFKTLKFLAVNQATIQKYQYSPSDFAKMTILEIRPKKEINGFLQHLKKFKSSIKVEHVGDRVHRKKDGTIFHVEVTRSPITFEGKQAVLVLALDISKRTETENRLLESEEKYRKLVEAANDAIILIDPATDIILDANKKAAELLEIPVKKIIGMKHSKMHPKEILKKHSMEMKETLKKGRSSYETVIISKTGKKIPAEVSGSAIEINGKKILQSILRDITQRKHMDDMKTEFLSVASHELKTPITTLKLVSQSLIKKMPPDTEVFKHARLINKEVDRLTNLINELLDVSRIDTQRLFLNLEIVNLTQLIRKVIQKMRYISTDHKIIFIDSVEINVIADPHRIEQVLVNIISNSIKYSKEKSSIVISLKKQGKLALTSVKDEGIGIPQKQQKHIFDRFFQMKEHSATGFGLGLYISKKIIDQHKGKIWVDSKQNRGSTFYFTLPRTSHKTEEPLEPLP